MPRFTPNASSNKEISERIRKGFGAGGRTRTDMRSEPRQILSLVRIPISPLRLVGHVIIEAANRLRQTRAVYPFSLP